MPDETAPPLPTLVEGVLSDGELESLFAELGAHARIVEVLAKSAARGHAAERPSLAEAYRLLLAGAVRAVQIRYRFDGAEWTDTLLPRGMGFRLVRCRHDGP